ncbi:flagellar type III secretion system pore protein FliP [Maricaulis sp. CAU 1757]
MKKGLWIYVTLFILGVATLIGASAEAQSVTIDTGTEGGLTERVLQLIALLTVLSLAPSIIVMTTSFVRIIVVLSLLRTGLGLQQSPPNAVLISLAIFMSGFIMAPVLTQSYEQGIQPLLQEEIELPEAFERSSAPLKTFMLSHVREDDLALFIDMSQQAVPASPEEIDFWIVAPAFMISELRRAFEIGFLLFIPFLVIDLVVASILMSMGMMMLPPIVISLPFKLIFFVLVDGWRLVVGSLVQSFGTLT